MATWVKSASGRWGYGVREPAAKCLNILAVQGVHFFCLSKRLWSLHLTFPPPLTSKNAFMFPKSTAKFQDTIYLNNLIWWNTMKPWFLGSFKCSSNGWIPPGMAETWLHCVLPPGAPERRETPLYPERKPENGVWLTLPMNISCLVTNIVRLVDFWPGASGYNVMM